MSELAAEEWVAGNVEITSRREHETGTLIVEASCQSWPQIPRHVFELLTHPRNYEIFRNIQRCTYRKMLFEGGSGDRQQQLVEVENESDYNFFVLRGAVQTRMLVEQTFEEATEKGMMHFTLAPYANSPLRALYGRWTINPITSDDNDNATSTSSSSMITLTQRFTPNIPHFLFPAFARISVLHIKRTFEDLFVEVQRCLQGTPVLEPYSIASRIEIVPEGSTPSVDVDPRTVLAALRAAASGHSSGSSSSGSAESRASGASMASSSLSEPCSHVLNWSEVASDAACGDVLEGWSMPLSKRRHPLESSSSYFKRLSVGMRSVLRWIDEHIPMDEDALENAWASAFGTDFQDFPRGIWLVVA